MPRTETPDIAPGFVVIHANRMEDLRQLLTEWMQANPLAPLENEILLVQSNGMAQWLRLAVAEQTGIAASLSIELPARFLWGAYRAVLGEAVVDGMPPLDESRLVWRLMQCLPDCLADPAFAPLARFVAHDPDGRARYQLCARLADLFDQYQVYRADWLADWAAGRDVLSDGRGGRVPVPQAQRWQPVLWRHLLASLQQQPGRTELPAARSEIHRRFVEALHRAERRPPGLPRRVIVFGISSLPAQVLEALAAIGRHALVLLCVHNPCQHYWADIVDQHELLRARRRRQPRKPGMPEDLDEHSHHLHANPLLASLGKQGRDYIRLLDEFDDPQAYRARFDRIDLFVPPVDPDDPAPILLQQVQQAILDLSPLPTEAAQRALVRAGDDSIRFCIAHSPQREVEILHDQLLALFEAGQDDLRPRDVIVMVPDIRNYAPHIEAVFGQFEQNDSRHIPFSIADQQPRLTEPVLRVFDQLLELPQSRVPVSEVIDLLEVPAVRKRFGLAADDIPLLHRWVRESGIRWGLDAGHRHSLNLPEDWSANSWRFGLRRMLLGYASGEGAEWAGIEPFAAVSGLAAEPVGALVDLVDALDAQRRLLAAETTVAVWGDRLRAMIERFVEPVDEADRQAVDRVLAALESWQTACADAGFDGVLPLATVRQAVQAELDAPRLSQRFLVGRVTICTLMPMRAVPFKVVCLLGMNDGAYPRSMPPLDFDLMARGTGYRPGDRSRREDDRYLFLEALLSARSQLLLSWVGRSPRDNARLPPSVLVAQLRDYLAAGWRVEAGDDLLDHLTTEHPLQPFSPRYFEDNGLFTYAREWRRVHDGVAAAAGQPILTPPDTLDETVLDATLLARFLRHPVRSFFDQRLKVRLQDQDERVEDIEPFGLDGLDRHQLAGQLVEAGRLAGEADWLDGIALEGERLRRAGRLPLGAAGDEALEQLSAQSGEVLKRYFPLCRDWPDILPPQSLDFDLDLGDGRVLRFEDWAEGIRANGDARLQWVLNPDALRDGNKRWKWHKLLSGWLRHLSANAAGLNLGTCHIGADAVMTLQPMTADTARALLTTLAECWVAAQCAPPPLACKTGFAWVKAYREALEKHDDPEQAGEAAAKKARDQYLSGFNRTGERDQEPALARAWPELDALLEAGLPQWAERLYGPLVEAVEENP
ncbi:MAG: exodeoxyribonuclease V subunit gamma [Halothiobacillaceae bacterium]